MNKKLYALMNWADIEEIVYGEALHPEKLLGARTVGKSTLIQCFFPGAEAVTLYIEGAEEKRGKTVKEEVEMDLADEAGFFAALLPGKDRTDYYYHVTYEKKEKGKKAVTKDFKECYINYPVRKVSEYETALSGSDYAMQNTLGAVKKTINGVRGTLFSVWAPSAMRVSVIGDFNSWNPISHQMVREDITGVFELFVPGLESGEKYKFEILIKGGEKLIKTDPFAALTEEEGCAAIVYAEPSYKWTDKGWVDKRGILSYQDKPMNIYEISQSAYGKAEDIKKVTERLIAHMKACGYTHLELMPLLECYNESCGFKPSCFFTYNHRFGKIDELKYLINALHNEGLGVIAQWAGQVFDDGEAGMSFFDGTCLYEHEDFRKGIDARNGARIFQYGNATVEAYIISSLFKMLETFHLDGIKFTDISSLLYLDYYRAPGEWVPNIYGSNENLEYINFLKKVNKLIHTEFKGVFTIADEESGWPMLTLTSGRSEEEKNTSLGFDYCLNKGFNSDVIYYMECDPIMRSSHHNELIMSIMYQYSENYILSLNHSNVDFGKGGLITRMPGDEGSKLANLKAFYGYLFTHPGKKQVFMGQDWAARESFDSVTPLNTELDSQQKLFSHYFEALGRFYKENSALYKNDYAKKGFNWIKNNAAYENLVAFERKSDREDETLLVVINFANMAYDKYKLGVPDNGKYKEVFSSDAEEFGGSNLLNSRIQPAKPGEADGFASSITIKVAPLSVSIFKFIPYTKAELEEIERKRQEKENAALEKLRKKEALAKEKARIRASLKEELERKIRDAERAIEESGK